MGRDASSIEPLCSRKRGIVTFRYTLPKAPVVLFSEFLSGLHLVKNPEHNIYCVFFKILESLAQSITILNVV